VSLKYNIIISSFLILTLFAASSSAFLLPNQDAEASHISIKWKYRNWTDVEVKITNSGKSTAKNMYVWVAWDKDEKNKNWEQKKYGPSSLKPGYTKTVTMHLDKPPVGEWTRFRVSVWGDNFNTVKDYADKWIKRGSSTGGDPPYGSDAYWDKVCKEKYGSDRSYQRSTHTCVKTTRGGGGTGNCGGPGWISISTPTSGIRSTTIIIDGNIFNKGNASMKVNAGTHVVAYYQETYSGYVKTWGPETRYVDNCKQWTVRHSG